MKDAKVPELQKANKSKRAAETKVIIASKFKFRLDSSHRNTLFVSSEDFNVLVTLGEPYNATRPKPRLKFPLSINRLRLSKGGCSRAPFTPIRGLGYLENHNLYNFRQIGETKLLFPFKILCLSMQ